MTSNWKQGGADIKMLMGSSQNKIHLAVLFLPKIFFQSESISYWVINSPNKPVSNALQKALCYTSALFFSN
jgi:hypothetical protein